MSRYLFVVAPFYSHIQPTVAVGRELARRGHAVAWVGHDVIRRFLPGDLTLLPLPSAMAESAIQHVMRQAAQPWLAGMKVLFEDVLAPLARDMLPGVEAAIESFAPDALVVDQQAFAGALAARRKGLPWATSATSAALYDDTLRPYPKVAAWLAELFAALERDAGLAPIPAPDRSPDLVVLYTTRRFAGAGTDYPAHYRFVGAALAERTESDDFPWHELRPGRRVFVTLGTLFAFRGGGFFGKVADALAGLPMQVILHAPPGIDLAIPPNFIVRPWVPLMRLYPMLDAVVTHGGTTVVEAMAFGLPAVVAPMSNDQFVHAQCAVAAGAARRIGFARVTAAQLREAVLDVMDNPAYAAAARDVQASFREAGGATAAATAIEGMR